MSTCTPHSTVPAWALQRQTYIVIWRISVCQLWMSSWYQLKFLHNYKQECYNKAVSTGIHAHVAYVYMLTTTYITEHSKANKCAVSYVSRLVYVVLGPRGCPLEKIWNEYTCTTKHTSFPWDRVCHHVINLGPAAFGCTRSKYSTKYIATLVHMQAHFLGLLGIVNILVWMPLQSKLLESLPNVPFCTSYWHRVINKYDVKSRLATTCSYKRRQFLLQYTDCRDCQGLGGNTESRAWLWEKDADHKCIATWDIV